jgi:hypothetical protein
MPSSLIQKGIFLAYVAAIIFSNWWKACPVLPRENGPAYDDFDPFGYWSSFCYKACICLFVFSFSWQYSYIVSLTHLWTSFFSFNTSIIFLLELYQSLPQVSCPFCYRRNILVVNIFLYENESIKAFFGNRWAMAIKVGRWFESPFSHVCFYIAA